MANKTTNTVSEAQLRAKRISVYRKMMPAVNLFRGVNGKVLHPAPAGLRHSNFLKFVELYFYKVFVPDNQKYFPPGKHLKPVAKRSMI